MANQYKVPKIEKDIVVQLDGQTGSPEKYTAYLNCISRYGNCEETIEEFLKEAVDFFGVKSVESGKFSIINHGRIVYVLETEEFEHDVKDKLKVVLSGGEDIEVHDYMERPDQYSRILDYLNSGDKFLSFLHEKKRIYINREKILRVEVQ